MPGLVVTETLKIIGGDYVFDQATGRFVTVTGREKLRQDCRQNLDTDVQPDGTGAGLTSVIGKLADPFDMRIDMTERVTESFEALKDLQQRFQLGDRSKQERIARISAVQVFQTQSSSSDEFSKTDYTYRVDIQSEDAREKASITGRLVQ